MTTPFWCLLAVIILPILLAGLGGYYRGKELGSADNNHPRTQAAQLSGTGPGARAYAAQANAWEALAMFAPAVLVAHLAGVPETAAAPWAIAFVVARILHPIFYVRNLAPLRSLSFFAGIVCVIALFVQSA